jgi:DNA-binding transcriptional LysR family regulator
VGLDWDDFRYVLALRRAGSLGAAARSLEVEQSTASRRLAALEAALGAKLVTRTGDGVVLNEAGHLAADLAETIERGVDDFERKIGGADLRPEGVVRLATTETMASFLMAGLIPLRREHPKIQVELVVSNAPQDLMRREADLAVRLFREQNPALVARKIGDVGWSIYASSTYVERTKCTLGAELSLHGHAVIGYGDSLARSAAAAWIAAHARPEDIVLTGGSVAAVQNAIKAGIGISVLPCFTAHADAALVRLTDKTIATIEAFLVIPPDHKDTLRVRLVMDAIAALFSRERAALAG